MFKGYVEMKGKRPIESIKNRSEFSSLDQVKDLEEYGGVLSDEYILIDIDSKEESEILHKIITDKNINCTVIQTTRGKHFYFKNTGVKANVIHKPCALGLIVDIKLGSKNAVIPLKIKGKVRPMTSTGTIDDLPKWLSVISKTPDFNNLEEGDGRNQTLFNYILSLQRYGFTKEEIKETISIINDYILVDKLPVSELLTILRDESFQKESFFDESGKWSHDLFGTFLQREYKIIKINGELHYYDNGVYVNNLLGIEKLAVKHIPSLNRAKRSEVLTYINIVAEDVPLSPPDKIVVNNGLLDIETLELEPFDPNYIAVNKLPINYNPNAKAPVVDQVLNKIACNDPTLRSLIEEMAGYPLLRRPELGRCFILTGRGSNGKSTLLDMIKGMLGEKNVSAIGMEEIEQRFKTADIVGKLANIGDDISNNYMPDNAKFKKLVTGESLIVERKGKDPFEIRNFGKLIFSANEIPRVNDTSDGLTRRLIIVPFNARFSSNDPDYDPYIKDKLMKEESLEYLLILGLKGLKRMLKKYEFTQVESVKKELEEYERINNPILAFREEFKINNEPIQDVYNSYVKWCYDSGMKPVNKNKFTREINDKGYTTKQIRITKNMNIKGYDTNDRVRIFVKK
ncbi:DNA primase family protein [Clostridium chromiireducens]|uniref:DNA primase family protein n=1 Tax=Clostridium chromiireducens TaxID=225345 RepID=UPI003AF749CF